MNGSVVRVYDADEPFNRCTPKALTDGWFDGQLVVDALLRGYRVDHAELVADTGRRLFKGWLAPRVVEIRRVYREGPFPMSLEEIKAAVQMAIDADRDHWEELGELRRNRTACSRRGDVWRAVRGAQVVGILHWASARASGRILNRAHG